MSEGTSVAISDGMRKWGRGSRTVADHVGSTLGRREFGIALSLIATAWLCSGCWLEPTDAPTLPDQDRSRAPFERGPVWSPDGTRIAFVRGVDGTLRVADVRSGRFKVISDGVRSTWDVRYAWSNDGTRLAFVSDDQTLRVADLRSGRSQELLDGVSAITHAPWSPDGRALAVTSIRDGTSSARCFGTGSCPELYVAPVDGGRPRRLTVNATYERAPVWSPDGTRLAFLSGHNPSDPRAWRDVRVADLERGAVRTLTDDARIEWYVEWDRTGDALVIETDDRRRFKLFLNGRRVSLPPLKKSSAARWTRSPLDGTIAYISTRDRNGRTCWTASGSDPGGCAPNGEVYLRLPAGGHVRVTHSRVDEDGLAWSPDGRTLAFASGGKIMLVNASGKELRLLTG